MGEPLRVLIVEDSEGDALLLLAHLKRSGYDPEWERVEDRESMAAALDRKNWDIIISDHSMPRFSAPAALAMIKERALDLPFIIVSGVIGEEIAVASMRAGAHDYLKKGDLARLVPAIERELRDATARREHRRVEEALLESLQTSMETVQAIPSGLFIYQYKPPDRLVLVFGNPEAERLAATRIEEWLGKDFNEIWPGARAAGITRSFLDVVETGKVFESEELSYEERGRSGVFRVRAFPMAGRRLGVAFENVTDRRRAEEALARESEINAAIAELSRALIQPGSIEDLSSLLLDCAKQLTGSEFGYVGYIDPATGYLVSTTMTKDIWETCQVPNKNIVFEKFCGLWGWVLDQHEPLLTNSPSEDPRSSGTPVGHIPIHRFLSAPALIGDTLVGQVALANSDRDYTERDQKLVERLAALYAIAIQRMRAEEELQDRSHELGERVKELNCLYGISRLVETADISLEEILQGTADLIPPSWQYPEVACARIMLEGEEIITTEGCVDTPWGQSSDISAYGERIGSLEIFYLEERPERDEGPFLKEERDLINAIAERLGRIIEKKQTEEALREEREKARNYLDLAGTMIVAIGADGNVGLINRKGCEVLGYDEDDIVGKNWFDTFLPDHIRERVRDSFKGILAGRIEIAEHYENPVLTKAGEQRIVAWHNAALTDKAGNIIGTLSSGQDITERKQAEEALRESEARYRKLSESLEETVKEKVAELNQAESLAAIGRMVSIVAHEVRNPLQNIQMGVDSMRIKIGEDGEKTEILGEIDYGVNLLNGIIGELLDYSRPVTLKRSQHSVRDLVNHALKTMTHKLENIDVQLELEHDTRKVVVDALRIGAVLVNLVSNAAEAMPAGGALKISSGIIEDEGVSMLRLSIADTGCGIDEENLKRIHEPFFTTKTKGTGLGIPVCKKIIDAHDGKLIITSKVDEGTTVDLWLPFGEPRPVS